MTATTISPSSSSTTTSRRSEMTIRRRQFGLNHAYYDVVEDPETGDTTEVKVPGVTTLLGDGIPKGGLTNWAAEQAAQYAIEHWDELTPLPLLKRAKEIQYAWQRERDAAAGRGTTIHKLAEQLHAGHKVEVPDGLEGHVEACVRFLDDYDVQSVLSETAVVNRTIGYAGTLDLVADIGGQRWILDWKTGRNVYAEAALQLAAYAHAEHWLDGKVEKPLADVGIERGGVVHLRADGFDVYPMNIGDRPFGLFRHAAYVGRWVKWDKDTRRARIDEFKGPALQPPAAVEAVAQ